MKIVLASGNKGKIKEIQALIPQFEVVPYSSIIGDFEVVEDGITFKQNAIKKAKEIYEKIDDPNCIVISDDSGLSVPVLNGEPGIYSARYAGLSATDTENNQKLITKLNSLHLHKTPAHYTACIAMVYKNNIYTTHGWLYGDVVNYEEGDGGFGYDPLFIPQGYNQTLGVLDPAIKKQFSHRTKALQLMLKILHTFTLE